MGLKNSTEKFDAIGDNHVGTSSETPMRLDAFELTADEKIDAIKDDIKHIMETLCLDLSDDSLKGTTSIRNEKLEKENIRKHKTNAASH